MDAIKQEFICDACGFHQIDKATCNRCGNFMRPAGVVHHHGRCQSHNFSLDTGGKCARCEIIKSQTIVGKNSFEPISYIVTYSAHCVDGSVIQANLALSSVPAGTSPGSMIEMVTEQAYADIARSGKNATQVVVLNLSRVW